MNYYSVVTPEISCHQVREAINSLNNFSPGHDELPPYVEEFIQPIIYLVNFWSISVLSFFSKTFEKIVCNMFDLPNFKVVLYNVLWNTTKF